MKHNIIQKNYAFSPKQSNTSNNYLLLNLEYSQQLNSNNTINKSEIKNRSSEKNKFISNNNNLNNFKSVENKSREKENIYNIRGILIRFF